MRTRFFTANHRSLTARALALPDTAIVAYRWAKREWNDVNPYESVRCRVAAGDSVVLSDFAQRQLIRGPIGFGAN
jgi:hypothetical protein